MSLSYKFDYQFHKKKSTKLCGIDEVGRGPLAGPVVAAAVILPKLCEIPGVNDSKKLSAYKREDLAPLIRQKSLAWAIGESSEIEIDQMNIARATYLAMQRAINALQLKPDYLLVDGRHFPMLDYHLDKCVIPGSAIIKGDGKSLSIACASILAKVHRDQLMVKLSLLYPQYGFDKHKGYGTLRHRQMIADIGLSPIHRKTFIHSPSQMTLDISDK
jgi:ribonuclease HII